MAGLRVGIIGMGGFAGMHHDAVAALETAGDCRLVCTCDPRMADFAERQETLGFERRGVARYLDYREMLAAHGDELDVVMIPTPIPLHAAMHRACVERGIPVYLEKPPTLDYAELEMMLAVEAKAGKATNVGFNFIIEPERQALKARLVAGEFGPIEAVGIWATWPRPDSYYARATWAGRLLMDGRLVLDSCMGNAMAHQVHNGLFWCGQDAQWAWGDVTSVAAELYRGHQIEGTDTVFVEAQTAQGPALRVAMTHACHGPHRNQEVIVCRDARITYTNAGSVWQGAVAWHDGRTETWDTVGQGALPQNLHAYFDYVRGTRDRPMTRLVDSAPFVWVNDLAYLAAGKIATVPPSACMRVQDGAEVFVAIHEIDAMIGAFIESGHFPSEQGVSWATPGGTATTADLPRLLPTISTMVGAGA